MSKLSISLEAVKDRSSMLWIFYHPDEVSEVEVVEVRLNGSTGRAEHFLPPNGWLLHRIQWGDTFFIRREQAMNEQAIEEMLCATLVFADQSGMRFGSWQSGPDLAPDGFHP